MVTNVLIFSLSNGTPINHFQQVVFLTKWNYGCLYYGGSAALNKLTKSDTDEVFSGSLGGIAEHLNIDSALVRIVYCAFAVITGMFPALLIYFIMLICIPDKDEL